MRIVLRLLSVILFLAACAGLFLVAVAFLTQDWSLTAAAGVGAILGYFASRWLWRRSRGPQPSEGEASAEQRARSLYLQRLTELGYEEAEAGPAVDRYLSMRETEKAAMWRSGTLESWAETMGLGAAGDRQRVGV